MKEKDFYVTISCYSAILKRYFSRNRKVLIKVCINTIMAFSMRKQGGRTMPADEQKLWTVWGKSDGLYNSWAASRNINYYLLLVLYALEGQKAMTQKKICICTGLTKQTVNSVIRSLKKDGYIELVPGTEDRREKQIALTGKGIAYSRELLTPLLELEHRVFQIMGNDKVQQMVDNIALFNTVFEKEMEKDM